MIAEDKVLFRGTVDGKEVRILQVADDDCIVEEQTNEVEANQECGDGYWKAADDELASHAYMAALLEKASKSESSEPINTGTLIEILKDEHVDIYWLRPVKLRGTGVAFHVERDVKQANCGNLEFVWPSCMDGISPALPVDYLLDKWELVQPDTVMAESRETL